MLSNALIERDELPGIVKMSLRTIEEEIRQGRFPRPKRLSGRRAMIEADLNDRFDLSRVYAEDDLPEIVGIEVERLRRLISSGQFPASDDGRWAGAELKRWEEARLAKKPWKPCRLKKQETELYRHFDARGILLYVGISISTPQRLKGHRFASGWFKKVATITIQRFPTRAAAEQAERAAIRDERPLHNIAHAGKA
jgi:hypothetical protein